MKQAYYYKTLIKKLLPNFNHLSCLVLSIFILCLPIDIFATDYTYNGGIGNWSDATKWTPNGIPGASDNVTISSNSLTLDIDVTVNNVTLSANLLGSNTLTVNGIMTWTNGAVNASIIITNTGTLNLSGSVNTGNLTLEGIVNHSAGGLTLTNTDIVNNTGTYNLSGGAILINSGTAQFNNNGDFNISTDGTILAGTGPFNNNGTCTKTSGAGTTFIDCVFNNDGTFNHDFGNKLDFDRDLIQNGTLNLNGSEELETDRCTVNSTFTLASGQIWDSNNILTMNIAYTTSADLDVGHHLFGTGSLTINHTLTKSGQGNLSIPITVSSGATFNHTYSSSTSINTTLNLEGTSNHTNGSLSLGVGETVNNSGEFNLTGGRLNLNNSSTIFNNTGTFNYDFDGNNIFGAGDFNNSGTFSKTGGAGTSTVSLDFTNSGIISGNGSISFDKDFNQNNNINPGNSPGSLTLNKLNNTNGILNIEIENNSGPEVGHDEINISGTNTLEGTLNVTLLNNFVPNLNDSYTIINCTGGCSGTFDVVNFPLNASGWDIIYNANSVVLMIVGSLPVELIDFSGEALEKDILLKWSTANEVNNRGFEIQRSKDVDQWEAIGFIQSNGHSNSYLNYSFKDTFPFQGLNYYRLKQLDHDGRFEYSSIVTAKLETQNISSISEIFPNPILNGTFNVEVTLKNHSEIRMEIFDAFGRMVYKEFLQGKHGLNQLQINLPELSTGSFFSKITVGQDSKYQKLIVL